MEGLIPMVCRAIKRNRVRSRYECLSSQADQTYDIPEFYPTGSGTRSRRHSHLAAPPASNLVDRDPLTGGGACGGHFRHFRSSTVGYSFRKRFILEDDTPTPRKQRMVRFRSIRMLSCLTGA